MANYRIITFVAVVILAATAFTGVAMSSSQDNVNDAQDMIPGDRIVIMGATKDVDVHECWEQIKALKAELEQKIAELEDEKAERMHAVLVEHQEIYDQLYRVLDDSTAAHTSYASKVVVLAEKIRITKQAGGDATELQNQLEKCKADIVAIKELIERDKKKIAAENERYEAEVKALEEEFSIKIGETEDFYYAEMDEIKQKMNEMFEKDVAVASPIVSRQVPAPPAVNVGEALAAVPFAREYGGMLPGMSYQLGYLGPHHLLVATFGLDEISQGEFLINSIIPGEILGIMHHGEISGFFGQPQMNLVDEI